MADLEVRHLRYFLAVADHGSISAAARALHVTQPTVSQQLRAMERSVGGSLLRRGRRGVELTPAGRRLRDDARQLVDAADGALRRARAVAAGDAGELRVGTVNSLAARLLPAAVARWLQANPGVALGLHEHRHADELEDDVAAGGVDLAIGPPPRREFATVEHLGTEEFVVVAGPDDDLLVHDRVPAGAIADRRWVGYAPGHGLSEVLASLTADVGAPSDVVVRTAQVDAAARFAAAGAGLAIVPQNALAPDLLTSSRPLDPPLLRDVVAYGRHDLGPLALPLVQAVADQLEVTASPATPRGGTAER